MAANPAKDPSTDVMLRMTDVINGVYGEKSETSTALIDAMNFWRNAGTIPYEPMNKKLWQTGYTTEVERLVTSNPDVASVLTDAAIMQDNLDDLFQSRTPPGILAIHPFIKLDPNVYEVHYHIWEATQLFFEPAPTGVPAPINAIGAKKGKATLGRAQASVQMKVESLNGTRGTRMWAWHMREIVGAISYYVCLNTIMMYLRQSTINEIINRNHANSPQEDLNGTLNEARRNHFGAANKGDSDLRAYMSYCRMQLRRANPNVEYDTELAPEEVYAAANLYPATAQNMIEGKGDGMEQARRVTGFTAPKRIPMGPLLNKNKEDITLQKVHVPLFNVISQNGNGPAAIEFTNWATQSLHKVQMRDAFKGCPFFKADEIPTEERLPTRDDFPEGEGARYLRSLTNAETNIDRKDAMFSDLCKQSFVFAHVNAQTPEQKAYHVCEQQFLTVDAFKDELSRFVSYGSNLEAYLVNPADEGVSPRFRYGLSQFLTNEYRAYIGALSVAIIDVETDDLLPILQHIKSIQDAGLRQVALFFAMMPLSRENLIALDSAGVPTFVDMMLLRVVEFVTAGLILLQSGEGAAVHYVNNLGFKEDAPLNTQEKTVLIYFYWTLAIISRDLIVNIPDVYIKYCSKSSTEFVSHPVDDKTLDYNEIMNGRILAVPVPAGLDLMNCTVIDSYNTSEKLPDFISEIVGSVGTMFDQLPTVSRHAFDIKRSGDNVYYEYERAYQRNVDFLSKRSTVVSHNVGRLGKLDTPDFARMTARPFGAGYPFDYTVASAPSYPAIAAY